MLEDRIGKPRSFGNPGDDNYRAIIKIENRPGFFVDITGEELTADRCREYAKWLLRAADWIDHKRRHESAEERKQRHIKEGQDLAR